MNTFEGEQGVRLTEPDPLELMDGVLKAAEQLSDEERKRFLRLSQIGGENRRGYKYDYLLGKDESMPGGTYLEVKLIPNNDMGVNSEPWHLAYLARCANPDKTVLRTGFLQIDESSIRDVRPVDLIQFSDEGLEQVLKLHFPNHEVSLQCLD